MYNYSILPEHCRDGMKLYIEDGIFPGNFLQAVICNDLVRSFSTADHINTFRLKDYARFLYWEIPTEAWGSMEKMNNWKGTNHLE